MKNLEVGNVPCDGCTLCCKNDMISVIGPEVSEYLTERDERSPSGFILAHKSNGDCIYLDEKGCSIHDRRPSRCREMDCRIIALRIRRCDARELNARGALPYRVYQRGKDLLRVLTP